MRTEDIVSRCDALIARGESLLSSVAISPKYGRTYWVDTSSIADAKAWLSSSQNLVRIAAPRDSHFHRAMESISADPQLLGGFPAHTADAALGTLRSLREELDAGLLRSVEYYYVAIAFDDFLEHAEQYHKSGRKIESAVLGSAVFEDAVRKTAEKHSIPQAGIKTDALIDALVKANALSPVKAKRWKAYAGVRNAALHAQWDDIEIRDVGDLIHGTKEIVEAL